VKATVPSALDSSHQSKLDQLKGLNSMMLISVASTVFCGAPGTDGVSLFERYAKSGGNADLKAFASKYLPRLKEHQKLADA